ncbi:MAG: InlB B-repeat-containing protein [Bacteroidia bacterium]
MKKLIVLILLGLISCSQEESLKFILTVSSSSGGTVNTNGGEYPEGSSVTLIATPDSDYVFSNWSGSTNSTSNPLTVIVDGNKSIQANFEKKKFQVNISIEGEGNVNQVITGKSTDYEVGTKIELTAVPDLTWKFLSWGGNISSTENPYALTVNSNFNITAKFEEAYIYVPDNNFEQALIDLGYDDVLDDLVLIETAESITSLQLAEKNISNLEGINSFKNLTYLGLYNNNIGQINISNLEKLIELDLTANNVSQVNFDNNLELQIIRLNGNPINEVDVTGLSKLRELYLNGLPIDELDLSENPLLTNLDIEYTNLSFLDLSNCPDVSYLLALVNSDLCIKVDQNKYDNIPGPCLNENHTTCFDTPNWNISDLVSLTITDECIDQSIGDFGFELSEVSGFQKRNYNGFNVYVSDHTFDLPQFQNAIQQVYDKIDRIRSFEIPSSALELIMGYKIVVDDRSELYPDKAAWANSTNYSDWILSNGFDSEFVISTYIINIENWVSWEITQPDMLLHEIAHIFHNQVLGRENQEIIDAYNNALTIDAYYSVPRLGWDGLLGDQTDTHYALTNPEEYFAELVEAYFGKNDWYPNYKNELESFDPTGYYIVESLFK